MGGFNLADSYRAAGMTMGPDDVRMRQEPFDNLRKAIDPRTAIDLVRFYFGLSVPRGTDWFRDAFGGNTDPSFSLIDNAREGAVLAAGLLEAAAADGKIYAALAILTTSASGLRQPVVRPELVDAMKIAIQEQAIRARQQPSANPKQITAPTKSKISADLAALVTAPDLTKAAPLLKQVSEESAELVKTLTNQVFSVVQPLAAQVVTSSERKSICFGGISAGGADCSTNRLQISTSG